MATARQIAANQANSLRSTGPRSPEGKSVARANSYKHGLTGRGVVMPQDEAEVALERFDAWCDRFAPADDYDARMVETAAFESVRVDRCRLHEVALREHRALRARDFWDIDRRRAAAELAARLPKSPETVAWQLQETLQGVELLIGRWEALGKTLAMTGTWDEADRSEALDLLGVRRDRRQGWTELVPDPGDFLTEAQWFGQHVECRLRDLRALRPGLAEHDEIERLRAMEGHASPADAELKRLRRYERGCLRTLQWAVAQLKARQKDKRSAAAGDGPAGIPEGPALRQWREERREESRLRVERFAAWAELSFSGVDHESPDPDALLAATLAAAERPVEADAPQDIVDDRRSDDAPSPRPTAPVTHVLSKPVPLTSALLNTVPGNRRARRAAKSRARRG
jgi:hypothetical protein